ncbi:MAG TPA: NAD(+)/NADH kinase [Egibacteraceae bacterium]|nr:NAD(+)/NADH kinase [Egibacteraceae bacterium]
MNAPRGPANGTPPKVVGIVVHGGRPVARTAAAAAVEALRDTGVRLVGCVDDGWLAGTSELDPVSAAVDARDAAAFCSEVDVVVVFGGDGTFLRAAYLARDRGLPLLGVNLGRLGFLSEVEVADVPAALRRIVAGEFTVEERMTLTVEVRDASGGTVATSWALNEASVERVVPQRLIVIEVRVGDTLFARVPADAMICATPTGSTAYAFSARGPILSPLVEAILLVPVAPHSLFDRTLVVDPRESLSLRPVAGPAAVVSLDGREPLAVPDGGSVVVHRGAAPVRMVRLGASDFYGRVRRKFGLQ